MSSRANAASSSARNGSPRVGDFVNVPRGTVHRFENQGTEATRMILTFTPAGSEKFFEETLQRTLDPTADVPDNVDAIAARYVAAAPRYGMEFVVDGDPRAEILEP
jgi:hypothetical protein